ncbi:MAG: S-adenosyl-L-methionine-dependent methyltransferase [Monoraphidium minutum]|nr:MAG: S-adenosyl-L-methionine-dependent methyltransferase [Monoraphidium minutum]
MGGGARPHHPWQPRGGESARPPAGCGPRTLSCSAAPQRSAGEAGAPGRGDALPAVDGGGGGGLSAKQQLQGRASRKQRLDDYCLTMHPEYSKNLIQSWIVQGKVLVNDRVVTKAGTPVPKHAAVRINAEQPKYVCRAGHKLEAALEHFGVDVTGLTALDAGLSTGGFTDCLLQRGVGHVFGVDVGYGQVVGSIAQDPRVTVMERTNLRHLRPEDLPARVDLVTLDLSFISVLKVMPAVAAALRPSGGQLVVLIKPQFEAGKGLVSAGGVVRDPKVHAEVISRISRGIQAFNLAPRGVIESPLKGDKGGNTEFLAHFVHDPDAGPLLLSDAAAAAEAAGGGGGAGGGRGGAAAVGPGGEGGGGGGTAAAAV